MDFDELCNIIDGFGAVYMPCFAAELITIIMFKKAMFFSAATVLAAVVFMSCEGKQGEVGPAGPKGDSGAPGATGTKGDVGSANVIHSEWLPFPTKATASNIGRKNFAFAAPQLTEAIRDNGLIYGYVKYNTNGVVPLPYAQTYVSNFGMPNQTTSGSFLNTILVSVGAISFNQDWLTPGTIPPNFANSTSVVGGYTHLRYILIPGGQKAKIAGLDYTDYEAVKAHYGWED